MAKKQAGQGPARLRTYSTQEVAAALGITPKTAVARGKDSSRPDYIPGMFAFGRGYRWIADVVDGYMAGCRSTAALLARKHASGDKGNNGR